METTTLLICRGDTKIYERIQVSGMKGDTRLTTIVRDDGDASGLPCKLYPLDDAEFILVYPELSIDTAACELGIVDVAGDLTDSCCHVVDFTRAKWLSRINYRLHREDCMQMRRIVESESETYGDVGLRLDSAIGFPDRLLLQVHAIVPERVAEGFHVDILDTRLQPILLGCEEMGRYAFPETVPGDSRSVSIALSLEIPWNVGLAIVRVWNPDCISHCLYEFLHEGAWSRLLEQSNDLYYNDANCDPYYPEWFRRHKATAHQLEMQRRCSLVWPVRPKFSLVVPLYLTPLPYVRELLASVLAQTYSNWELLLVDASPEDEQLRRFVKEACANDSRVRAIWLSTNQGITLNTHAGVSESTGDFVSFLDHDDVIEPDLLFEYAKAIIVAEEDHRPIDVLYCDEDKLFEDGSYGQPFFKPDFSIDLLRNNNYICHMLTVRRSLLDRLPKNSGENDGAQDHSLILAAAEMTSAIHHVPKILYHWRLSRQSTAASADSKPYAARAGVLAVTSHLDRLGIRADVSISDDMPFTYDVRYASPQPHPLVSIVIPNKDHVELLRGCIESIVSKTTYDCFEIVVVENNSSTMEIEQYYRDIEARFPSLIRVVRWDGPFNYSSIVNFGCREAHGDFFLLLNNDTRVISCDWIECLLGNASREEVGVVGARLYYANETIQHAGVSLSNDDCAPSFQGLPRYQFGCYGMASRQRNVLAVTAACCMVRRDVFDRVGGFDEQLAVSYNDVDFCLRVRELGYWNVFVPTVELYHFESISRGHDEDLQGRARHCRERALLVARWSELFAQGDPYYTVNLRRTAPYCQFYHF